MTSPFRYSPRSKDVKEIVVGNEGTVGYFDTLGRYHSDPAKEQVARELALPDPEIYETGMVVNLEKNGAGLYVYIQLDSRDWFN